ncbi:MAG: hypothetical protein GY711_35435 [bacterium]|nr:hypothetical protein [bacterium]
MKELIQQVLALKGGDWTSVLTGKLGFSAEQASSFLPTSLKQIFRVVEKGKVDVGSMLTGSGAKDILENVNLDKIAEKSGLAPGKAREGLEQLVPDMLSAVKDKAGDADGLAAMLGGDAKNVLDQAGGIAGKLFGK